MKTHAKCLCGAVEIDVELANTDITACHCSMCRKWGGSPMLVVEGGQLTGISGESFITRFASSEWGERGFCSQCGTHLFYYFVSARQYHFPAGLLGDDQRYNFKQQIFVDEKPDFYSFSNETKSMTGAEVFALYQDE